MSLRLSDFDTILFDLGGVIINLDFNRTLDAFQKRVPSFEGRTFFSKQGQHTLVSEYEVGRLTTDEFVRSFNERYQSALTLEEFKECWNAMILDFPPARIELLRRLRLQGKHLLLLSNINELHAEAVEERFHLLQSENRFHAFFDKVFYSHLIGRRKPDADTFRSVLEDRRLDPARTLFIDDTEVHIAGAEAVGIRALHLKPGEDLATLPIFSPAG